MDIVKLGKKGQVSIPRTVIRALGLSGDSMLLVETTPDGTILLRPAGVYPIERYSDERVQEFLEADQLTPEEEKRVEAKLEAARRN